MAIRSGSLLPPYFRAVRWGMEVAISCARASLRAAVARLWRSDVRSWALLRIPRFLERQHSPERFSGQVVLRCFSSRTVDLLTHVIVRCTPRLPPGSTGDFDPIVRLFRFGGDNESGSSSGRADAKAHCPATQHKPREGDAGGDFQDGDRRD